MTNQIKNPLKVAPTGTDIYFSDNAELIEYLRVQFPQFTFSAPVTLTGVNARNSHPLVISTPDNIKQLSATSREIQDAIMDALLNYLDKVKNDLSVIGQTHAYAHMSSIELEVAVSHITQRTELKATLRAAFTLE